MSQSGNYAILVLSYNHPEITRRCLESVLLNRIPESRIFLVHNGSLDQHRETLQNAFPGIQHLVMNVNKGFTGGVNFGLHAVFEKYELVLFLTNDTELMHLPLLAPHGFSAVKSLVRQTERIDSIMGVLNKRTGLLHHLKQPSRLDENEIYYVPGTAFWMSREVFHSVGEFDESFHTYWEDVDYSLRAQKMGIQLQFSFDTVIRHKIGKTCHKNQFYTFFLFQRNRKKLMMKHGLTHLTFWIAFLYDILKKSKFRFRTVGRILYGQN